MQSREAVAKTAALEDGQRHRNRPHFWESVGSVREDEFSRTLLRMAQGAARRKGLPAEEVQDCGIGFVVHMLLEETLLERVRTGQPVSAAWLHTCADHWVSNFARRRRRLYAHEQLTGDLPEGEHTPHGMPTPSLEAESPEVQMIRVELMQRLLGATLSLTDMQRDLFTRRYLQECSLEEIAWQTGRTPGAIKQALAGVRRRLQALLIAAGLTQGEVAQYLHLLASAQVPAATPRNVGAGKKRERCIDI